MAALLLAIVPAAEIAAAPEVKTFTIYRDGDEIGTHVYRIAREGERVTVEIDMEISVDIAFVTVYRFTHSRREVWEGGALVSVESETDDDGEELSIQVARDAGGYRRSVNGRIDTFGEEAGPVSFWHRDVILAARKYFSVVLDEDYEVTIEGPARRELEVGGKTYETDFYRMTGNLQRDMWFLPDGSPLKLSFERDGSLIEYVFEPDGG